MVFELFASETEAVDVVQFSLFLVFKAVISTSLSLLFCFFEVAGFFPRLSSLSLEAK